MDQKKQLRFFYKEKIQKKDHSYKNQSVVENLSQFNLSQFLKKDPKGISEGFPCLEFQPFVAAYQPLKEEPSLLAFYRKNTSLNFVFPSVNTKGRMGFLQAV